MKLSPEEKKALERDILQVVEEKQINKQKEWLTENREIILYCLQNFSRTLLISFLHGGLFSKRHKLLYPFFIRYSPKRLLPYLRDLAEVTEALKESGVTFKDSSSQIKKLKNYNREITEIEIAILISTLYRELNQVVSNMEFDLTSHKISIPKIQIKKYVKQDKNYLKSVKEIHDYINVNMIDSLDGCYVHGSLGFSDYIKGYSDVDLLIVISKTAVLSPRKLIGLRSKMLRLSKKFHFIDPLQHHGIFILTSFDVAFFPQTYFPFVLFNYSQSLLDNKGEQIHFKERNSFFERQNQCWRMYSTFKEWYERKIKIKNLYDWKSKCQYFILSPLIYLQSKDIYLYKKEFFERIRQYSFDEEILNKISTIRRDWEQKVYNTSGDKIKRILIRIFSYILNVFLIKEIISRFLYRKIPAWIMNSVGHADVQKFYLCWLKNDSRFKLDASSANLHYS